MVMTLPLPWHWIGGHDMARPITGISPMGWYGVGDRPVVSFTVPVNVLLLATVCVVSVTLSH